MLCCEWVCRLLIAKAALLYNGHPPQTAEWVEVLTGAEPLYQTLSTVTQLKDSLSKATKREQQPAKLHQNIKLSPQSLKQERPAWMSLWCATTYHGDIPNKTIITPSHTYTVSGWSALQTCMVFGVIFFFKKRRRFFSGKKKKAKNFLLVSPVLVSCFCAGYSPAIQTLSPALPPYTRAAVVWHCLDSPWHPTRHTAFHLPLSEKKGFPLPWSRLWWCSSSVWAVCALF